MYPGKISLGRLLILLFTLNTSLSGESSGRESVHSVLVYWGVRQIKEKNLSPSVHSGLVTGIGYASNRKPDYSGYTCNMWYSRLKTTFEDLSASMNLKLDISVYWAPEILRKFSFARVAPELTLHEQIIRFPKWDESHLYWANAINLGLAVRKEVILNKSNKVLVIEGHFPVFSAFSRPKANREYKMDPLTFGGMISETHRHVEFGTINRWFWFRGGATIQFLRTKSLAESLSYSIEIVQGKASYSNSLTSLQHVLGFKVAF